MKYNVTFTLQNHQITAPRPKVHFCGDCGKGFAAKHGLLAHQRRYDTMYDSHSNRYRHVWLIIILILVEV